MANVISMKQLLEAGVHFGHPTKKWNPKMKRYIYTARNDIYIINLEKTVGLVDEAYAFVKKIAESGKSVLFVGTKKQAQEAVKQEAEKCGMYYVNTRWLGGMLTNFATMRSRVERLNKLNQMEKMGDFQLLPKKEVIKLVAERDKLEYNLGGVKDMRSLPGVLFVVDPKKEHIAIAEARNLKIPIVGIVDTNCNPDEVDYVIPGNDDAIRAIKLIAGAMADAVIEANEGEEGIAKRREIEATMRAEAEERAEELNKSQADDEISFEDKVAPLVEQYAKAEEVAEVKEVKEVKPAAEKVEIAAEVAEPAAEKVEIAAEVIQPAVEIAEPVAETIQPVVDEAQPAVEEVAEVAAQETTEK